MRSTCPLRDLLMPLIEINWNPSDKDLRNFGRIAIVASILVSALLYATKSLTLKWCVLIAGVGFVFFICSLLSMILTKWIYLGLTLITFPIGMAISFVLLAGFYFLLLSPMGLVFRLIRRDSLRRKCDRAAKSYWIARRPADKINRYFNQF